MSVSSLGFEDLQWRALSSLIHKSLLNGMIFPLSQGDIFREQSLSQ